jgi:tRNA (guanine26-N2/guanine27-N2)-dimethyltransferase
LTLAFPTETVREGVVSFFVPSLKIIVKKRISSKAPVFYNPKMELNRDIAVLALQTFQRTVKRRLFVCEPLTGCGVRGIRFAKEVEGVHKVVINDIRPEAAKLAQFNVKENNVAKKVEVSNEDANYLLSTYAAPRKRFDYIDVDPFGSPSPYLDSTVRALRNGGMLALTATDMAPLCGVHPKACIRKYGGRPLRTEYCHELALRLLIGATAMAAAKHDVGLRVLLGYSAYNHVRAYALLNYGAKEADKSIQLMGYILHCYKCFHRETEIGIVPFLRSDCPECSSKLHVAGPLWLGEMWNERFCARMQREAKEKDMHYRKEIKAMLSLVTKEIKAPVTYYVVDKLCDKIGLPIPSQSTIFAELQKHGFQVVPTHFSSRSLRTNAPAGVMKEILTELSGFEESKKTI